MERKKWQSTRPMWNMIGIYVLMIIPSAYLDTATIGRIVELGMNYYIPLCAWEFLLITIGLVTGYALYGRK